MPGKPQDPNIFAPKPSQLPPDPSQQAMSDADVASQFAAAQGAPAAAAPAPVADADVAAQFAQAQQQAQPTPAPAGGDLPVGEPGQIAAPNEQVPADLLARTEAGVGRNKNEEFRILERYYGPGNVKVNPNGEGILFRKNPKDKFSQVDPKGINSVMEFFGDLADMSGVGSDVAVGLMTDMLGKAASVGLGGLMGPVAGAAGVVGTAGASATAVNVARKSLVRNFGGVEPDPTYSDTQDIATNTGLNLVMMGLGSAGSHVMEMAKDTQLARIAQVAAIRRGFDKISESFAPLMRTKGDLGKELAGDVIEKSGGLIEKVSQDLSQAVGAVDNQLYTAAKQSGFKGKPTQTLAKMQEILDEAGVSKIQAAATDPMQAGKSVSRPLQYDAKSVSMSGAKDVMESKQGFGVLKDMTDDFNELSVLASRGGVPPDKLLSRLRYWQSEAKFDKDLASPKIQELFKELQHSAIEDRAAYASQVLGDGPAGQMFKSAYADYSRRIGPLERLKELYKQVDEAPERFVDALVEKGNSTRLRQVKEIFGSGSNEFNEIKAQWFQGLVEKHVSPTTGLFNSDGFLKEFDGHGKDVLNELLSKEEQNKVKRLAYNMSKIATSDLAPEKAVDQIGNNFALVPFTNRIALARWVIKMVSKNASAADYLVNDGYKELKAPLLAKLGGSPKDADFINFQFGSDLKKILTNEYRKVETKGGWKYILKDNAPAIAKRTAIQSAQQAITPDNTGYQAPDPSQQPPMPGE
jgi:hypothetical protein